MKTPDKYRFTLQWGAETTEKKQAGDFLEGLGNRKSELVVLAVTEYISAHPETLSSSQRLNIIVKPSYTREQVEAMVKAMIEEKLAGLQPVAQKNGVADSEAGAIQPDIDEMLKNIDLFSS